MNDGHSSLHSVEPRVAQLRALATVARTGSYTGAARELAYTESAVYLQIQALERSLGFPLFTRVKGHLVLTPRGEVVRKYALRILNELENLSREMQGLDTAIPVVVGGGRSSASSFLIPALKVFAMIHREIRLKIRVQPARDLLNGVQSGTVDVAICGSFDHLLNKVDLREMRLRLVPWIRSRLVLVHPAYAFLHGNEDEIYLPEHLAHNAEMIRAALERVWSRRIRLTFLEQEDAVKAVAVHGLGIAVLPAASVRFEQQWGLVRTMQLQSLPIVTIAILHREPVLMTPAARTVIAFLCSNRRSLIHNKSSPT